MKNSNLKWFIRKKCKGIDAVPVRKAVHVKLPNVWCSIHRVSVCCRPVVPGSNCLPSVKISVGYTDISKTNDKVYMIQEMFKDILKTWLVFNKINGYTIYNAGYWGYMVFSIIVILIAYLPLLKFWNQFRSC